MSSTASHIYNITNEAKAQWVTVMRTQMNQQAVVVPGESVAMLASDSTESSPRLLFAKIIEMNGIAKMTLLNKLVEIFGIKVLPV